MKKKNLVVIGVLIGTMILTSFSGCSKDKKEKSLIKIGKYTGIEVTVEPVEATEEEVDMQIQQYLSSLKLKDEDDKNVDDGDTINMDYVGKIDGEEFDGGSAQGADLTIGSGTFIPGFEDGLIDGTVGEDITVNVTFPEDYGKERVEAYKSQGQDDAAKACEEDLKKIQGKDAEFTVKVNYIYQQKPSELTDEILEQDETATIKTVDEYKEDVKQKVTKSKETQNESAILEQVLKAVVDDSKFGKLDEKKQKKYYDDRYNEIMQAAQQYNMDEETGLKTLMGCESAEEAKKQIETFAETTLKQELVIDEIGEKEKIDLSDEDFENMINEIIEQNKSVNPALNRDEVIKNYGSEDEARKFLKQKKICKFLIEKADVKYGDTTASEDEKNDDAESNNTQEDSNQEENAQ